MGTARFSPAQRTALELLSAGSFLPAFVLEDDGWHARWRALPKSGTEISERVEYWLDEYVRQAAMTPLTADAENEKHETLHDAWLMALRSRSGLVVWPPEECAAFAASLGEWSEGADCSAAGIVFTLGDDFVLHTTIPTTKKAYRALGQATYLYGQLRELKKNSAAARLEVKLSSSEAETFLKSALPVLKAAGYAVESTIAGAEIAAEMVIEENLASKTKATEKERAKLVIKVAGQAVGAAEIKFLLDQGSSIVYFRDHLIEVDRSILKEALRALEKFNAAKLPSPKFLSFCLGLGTSGRLAVDCASAGGKVRKALTDLEAAQAALQTTLPLRA